MREVIMTGKTVEEATALACEQLGVSEDDAVVEVIDLPQKKFFKTIPAKVRVSVEGEEETADAPETAPVKEAAPAAATEKPAAPAPEKKVAPKKEEPSILADATNDEPIDLATNEKAAAAVNYLRAVADKMDASNVEIEPVLRGDGIVLKVNGEDAGTLIGHRGEVMESLSYLCGLVGNRLGGDYTRVNLDVNNYRSKREANLIALAKRIATKVAKTGRSHTLEPMNPYERRIIHSAVSEVEGVKSESTGEGANRRVVISSTNPRSGGYDRDNRGGRGGYNRNGGNNRNGGFNKGGNHNSYSKNSAPRASSVPVREFADVPRDTTAAPSVPNRTERVNDGADLPLYGKIEL